MKHLFKLALVTFLFVGCAETPRSVTTNTTGGITIKSAAYTTTDVSINTTPVADFKFCITKIQLKNSEGSYVIEEGGSESIEAILGLIDVSTPSSAVTWGTITIPTGFTLGEMSLEVHTDAENCSGAEYSVSFNGTTITKDLEFKFTFNPAVEIVGNETLVLAIDQITAAFIAASEAGKLNNEFIGEYMTTAITGTGSKD